MIRVYFDFSAPSFKSLTSSFRNSLDFLNTVAVNSEMSTTAPRAPSPVCTSPKSDSLDQMNLEEEKLSVLGK
jgi:hypothetical protein